MIDLLQAQYNDVKGARKVLLDYCAGIRNLDLFKPVDEFNGNSIIKLLVHNANVYLHWLQYFDQQYAGEYFNDEEIESVEDLKAIYAQADGVVSNFIIKYKGNYLQTFSKRTSSGNKLVTTTPLQLFTHTITHEFHHKGQILTMSRLLGYTPVDTDVIRT